MSNRAVERPITTDDILSANLGGVHETIERAARRAGRSGSSVRLVAVTKSVSAAIIARLARLGIRDMGENRIQVATDKMDQVHATIDWHLIGHLQSNKSRRAVERFAWIHSIDSAELYHRVRSQGEETGCRPKLLCQVNVSGESTKHGFDEAALLRFLSDCQGDPSLVGLMTMAPAATDPEAARPVFRRLRELRDEVVRRGLVAATTFTELSMGMTDDYAVAVEEGATLVRVGRALFHGLSADEGA